MGWSSCDTIWKVAMFRYWNRLIIISLFALENNAHCLKRLQLVSTDYLTWMIVD